MLCLTIATLGSIGGQPVRLIVFLLGGLWCLLGGGLALAADGVRERLADAPLLRGDFEQTKHLRGFRNPLQSSGHFLLVRDQGAQWDTRQPFPSLTILTRDRLLSKLPDGQTRMTLDGDASPALAAINSLLLALLAGDMDALAEQFNSSETLLDEGAWTLKLRPRETALARLILGIELSGDRYVRHLVIEEHSGDRTEITFSAITDSPTLSAEEASRF